MVQEFDLIVIGAGPGGYTAALLGGLKGLKVALVEENEVGGVCLNRGCIPTKFLLQRSNIWREIQKAVREGLLDAGTLKLNYNKLMQDKGDLLKGLRIGLSSLLRARGIGYFEAKGKIVGKGKVLLKYREGREEMLSASNIIIAVGSSPLGVGGVEFGNGVLSSDEALELRDLPPRVLIIGGGVIGVEFAIYLSNLGSEVYIIEAEERILPREDKDISEGLQRSLKKRGIKIYTSAQVDQIQGRGESLLVKLKGGTEFQVEKVIVAVSRRGNLDGLWEDLELETQNGRFIQANEYLHTNVPGIYAIGDVKGGHMLAHVASYEAKIAVRNILGEKIKVDYSAVPICIFTEPQIARVGLKEEEAKAKGLEVRIAKFPFRALGRAHVEGKTEGFVKLIADERTKRLIGAHLIGPYVTEVINELSLAIKFGIPYTKLADVIHPHPTIAEAIQEALDSLVGSPIHMF